MKRFRGLIVPQLLISLLTLVLPGASAAAVAAAVEGNDHEQELQVLAMMTVLREIDDRCHLLTAEERGRLNLHVSELVRSLGVDPQSLTPPSGGNPIPCDDKIARMMIGSLRETVLAPVPAPSSEEGELTWEETQKMWQDQLRTLPAGRLAAYEGCWAGSLAGLAVEVCLTEKGDVVTVGVKEGDQEWCALAPGSARPREEWIVFSTPAATGTCKDGSHLQHLEGGCKPTSDSTLDCIFSVYSKGNTFYLLRGKPLNGQALLKRSTASSQH
ncbi:MAG TPA: hypothetical protein VLV54_01035 [Thermoanaerobaculia bacterium]|nr:hypothetical protein [Thermoanaerobaculia bacterium]